MEKKLKNLLRRIGNHIDNHFIISLVHIIIFSIFIGYLIFNFIFPIVLSVQKEINWNAIAAFGVLFAAMAAGYSAWQTKRNVSSQLFIQLHSIYLDDKMLDRILRIKAWKKKYGDDKWLNEFKTRREKVDDKVVDKEVREIDLGRRKFCNYLFNVYFLYDDGILNEEQVKNLVPKTTVKFLQVHVNALEACTNGYDKSVKSIFKFFYDLQSITPPDWFGKDNI